MASRGWDEEHQQHRKHQTGTSPPPPCLFGISTSFFSPSQTERSLVCPLDLDHDYDDDEGDESVRMPKNQMIQTMLDLIMPWKIRQAWYAWLVLMSWHQQHIFFLGGDLFKFCLCPKNINLIPLSSLSTSRPHARGPSWPPSTPTRRLLQQSHPSLRSKLGVDHGCTIKLKLITSFQDVYVVCMVVGCYKIVEIEIVVGC